MTTAYSGDGITFPDNSVQATAPRVGMVNRIINGDMRIDQRNAGAAVTNSGDFVIDRWKMENGTDATISYQQSSVAPAGFPNSIAVTISSGDASIGATQYASVRQTIEGYNIADLGFGTANAKTVTLSFWVRSSITGTLSGTLRGSSNGQFYPYTYTVLSANTWEYKTVTIAGSTTGTWGSTNNEGLRVYFTLAAGSTYSETAGAWTATTCLGATGATNIAETTGATFYVTGVQLEKGSTATDFEYVDYSRQVQQCQRFFAKSYSANTVPGTSTGASCLSLRNWDTSGRTQVPTPTRYPVTMRATPVLTLYSINGTAGNVSEAGASDTNTALRAVVTVEGQGENGFSGVDLSVSITGLQFYNWHYAASAEL